MSVKSEESQMCDVIEAHPEFFCPADPYWAPHLSNLVCLTEEGKSKIH